MAKVSKAGAKAAEGIIGRLVRGVCKVAKKPLAKDAGKAVGKDAARDGAKAAGKDAVGDGAKAIGRDGLNDAGRASGKDLGRDTERDAARRAAKEHPEKTSTPAKERTGTSDPVDVVTGDVFLTQTDVALPGVLPLVLERTHISSYRTGRAFGRSWASTLDMRLEIDPDGSAVLVTADGMLLVYRSLPVFGVVSPEAGPRWTLGLAGDGYLVRDAEAGISWRFGRVDRAAVDPTPADPGGGPVVEVPLVAVEHRCGDRIELRYDAHGRVRELVHSGGYRIAVTWSQDRVVLLSLHTANGPQSLARFGYATGGLLGEVVNASGLALRFDYDGAGRLVRWVDRNGHWYGYTYDQLGRCVSSTGSGGYLSAELRYDAEALTTWVTDAVGQVTAYTHGEHQKVVREVDPAGGVVERQWDAFGHLLTETDPTGGVTRFEYDHSGNLLQVTGPDGTATSAQYTADRQPELVTGPDGARRGYAYDEHGRLVGVTDPTGLTTTLGYDETGHLASVTDPVGAATMVACDGAGLPVRITDPTGAATEYVRDAAGRVVRTVDALGAVTSIEYTADGLPASRTGPDGGVETWAYDPEGNLTAHTSPAGAVTRFEYMAFDQPTARIEPDGTRLVFGYDAQLRLTSVTNPQGLTWAYLYDPVGRLIAETDFNGRTLRYAHDAAGRLVSRTNGLGQVTRLVRDIGGRLTARHAPEGPTTFGYDPAGRLVQATSPSADLRLAYDPAGRLLAETVDGRTIQFGYDGAGRRNQRTTPSGVVSAWAFDARHDPTSLSVGGHSITFAHDAVGNLIERRMSSASGWQALRQAHDPAGRLISQTLHAASVGLGDQIASAPGMAAQTRARIVAHRGYTYRSDGYLTAVADQAGGTRTMTLDPVGRITAVNAAGWNERYAYDEAGNLASATWNTSSTNARSAGGGGSAAHEGEAAQGERAYAGTLIRYAGRYRYEHDAQGRVVLRQRTQHSGRPLTWRYVWDSDDRLIGVSTPDGTRWSYRYDPLGRRLAKYRHAPDGSVAEQIDFCWDGVVLVEQTHHRPEAGQGPTVTTWEYQPGTFTPIVQHERHWLATAPQSKVDERFYGIIADLTGAPTHLTTPDGAVVWETLQTIWGTQTAVTRAGATCPIRLPGQYHDPETGHYYNNQRYYDPATARYLTQDPLGLEPAPNPNAYVPNPTFEVDPLGLAPQCGAIIADNDLMVKAMNGHEGALSEIENASSVHITPNQRHEFLDVTNGLNARRRFLEDHNIQTISGDWARQLSSTAEFRKAFSAVIGAQGRGDAALAGFASASGITAVTMERRLYNFVTQTIRIPGLSMRRVMP